MSELRPLKPLVAQRHSYKKGTLRYFERQYIDKTRELSELECSNDTIGGIGYWVDDSSPKKVPAETAGGKPLILVAAGKLDILRITVRE